VTLCIDGRDATGESWGMKMVNRWGREKRQSLGEGEKPVVGKGEKVIAGQRSKTPCILWDRQIDDDMARV
jgi:hypothetical protein